MNEIRIFENSEFGEVRTSITENNEVVFCLIDVCKALEHSNPSMAINMVDEDERAKLSLGRQGEAWFISETGVIALTLKSKCEKAKPFQRWVRKVVIPSILKTGKYEIHKSAKTLSDEIKAKTIAANWMIKVLRLNNTSKLMLAQTIAEPLGLPTPNYTSSKGQLLSATELLRRTGKNISTHAFNLIMQGKGLLVELERNSSKGLIKKFNSLTATGLKYGENQVSPKQPRETQPLYYESKFTELLTLLGIQQ